jgi:hypothetical protein
LRLPRQEISGQKHHVEGERGLARGVLFAEVPDDAVGVAREGDEHLFVEEIVDIELH